MFLWNIAVTSLAEVWIEMLLIDKDMKKKDVTSLAEVWIEITSKVMRGAGRFCHFPCGSVD